MKSLLEKAKEVKTLEKVDLSDGDIEMILGWLKGEFPISSVSKIKDYYGGKVYTYLALGLREAYKRKLIQ